MGHTAVHSSARKEKKQQLADNSLFASVSCLKQTAKTALVIVHLYVTAHRYEKTLPVEADPGKPQLDTTFKTVINTAERKLGL